MNILLIIIIAIVAIIVLFIIYRLIAFRKAGIQASKKRFERIKPLYDILANGQTPTQEDIYDYAKNLLTRETAFRLLKEHGKSDLFPTAFYNIEKGAESNLATWLEFPTELDGCPDEMEHVKKVSIDFDGENNFVHYHVFKFRTNEPHWAAKEGWMVGVVGPYFDDSDPYDFPHATFSRLSSKFGTTSPDEEAAWVHKNISLKHK